jgi:hypothetical protein
MTTDQRIIYGYNIAETMLSLNAIDLLFLSGVVGENSNNGEEINDINDYHQALRSQN